MASLEKLGKALEALKVFQPGNQSEDVQKKKDQPVTKKDKIINCNIIADCMCSQSLRNIADFPKFLGIAIETFLMLCDDPESDVRMVADESLNRTIKTLLDSNLGRLQVELYKEIKKNGPSRSLRAALWRFADMCHLIRPQKCRPYVVNLVPGIAKVSSREEEAIQETLQSAMKKVCPVLMGFANDNEIKTLLKCFLDNLRSPSAATRRTSANSMTWVCQYSRKPKIFFSWLLLALLDQMVPVTPNLPVPQILGVFLCLRMMLPQLACQNQQEQSLKGSFGQTKLEQETNIDPQQFIQIYELIIYYLDHIDHNVITAALETLQQLLKHTPKPLLHALLTPGGIRKNSILEQEPFDMNRSRTTRLPSVTDDPEDDLTSETSSERPGSADFQVKAMLGQGDMSTAESTPEVQSPSVESVDLPGDLAPIVRETDEEGYLTVTTDGEYSNVEIGSVGDDSSIQGSTADDSIAEVHRVSPKRRPYLRKGVSQDHMNQSVDAEDNLIAVEIDISEAIQPTACNQPHSVLRDGFIGSITDDDIPLTHCVRLLCSRFLLTGYKHGLVPDRVVRVSVKALALGCVACAISLHPKAFLYLLHKHSSAPGALQDVKDVLLYTSHSDPQLKGNAAILMGNLIHAALTESHCRFDLWAASNSHSEPLTAEQLVRQLISILEDESSVAVRLALVALQTCMGDLLNSVHSELGLQVMMPLLHLKNNPYWLVKVELLDLLGQIDFKLVSYLEQTCQDLKKGAHHYVGLLRIQEKTLCDVIIPLLCDEDARVRHAAATSLVKLVPLFFFGVDHPQHDPVIAKSKEYTQSFLEPILHEFSQPPQPLVHGLVKPFHIHNMQPSHNTIEASLSRVVAVLVAQLNQSTKRHLTYGCCHSLSLLSDRYPPTQYSTAWCYSPAVTPAGTEGNSSKSGSKQSKSRNSSGSQSSVMLSEYNLGTGGGPLSLIMSIITSSAISLDLSAHRDALQLAGNLFAGAAFRSLRPAEEVNKINPNADDSHWGALGDRLLVPLADILLVHVARLLNICAHVIDEQTPGPTQTKTTLPSLPNAPSLSPIKRKAKSGKEESGKGMGSPAPGADEKDKTSSKQAQKEAEKDKNKKDSLGQFHTFPHYIKLYETLKGAYSNYKISLDLNASEKFGAVLQTALRVLSQLLEIASMHEVGKHADELLCYLQSTFSVEPINAVLAVQQLLKALFGTNLASQWDAGQSSQLSKKPGKASRLTASMRPGLYYSCFTVPYTHFTQSLANASFKTSTQFDQEETTSVIGWLKKRAEKKIPAILKPGSKTDKNSIAAYIRLFEPLVIKALKQYTVTSSLELQQQVLNLLTQLVQLRVNYCLLDSDQIFIGFVIKQFEYIEDGQIRNSDTLVPHIFNFLVLLSYEKYHSKSIIGMNRVIQLCDGIMASGQQPTTHAIPALQPIVHDLFVLRGSSKAEKELDTQREVVVSMLLRLVQYYQVLDMFIVVLHQSHKESEEKWKRLSRQVVDTVLPKLAAQQLNLEGQVALDVLHRLFESVAPSVFRPVDLVLKTLMATPANLGSAKAMEQWLCVVLVVLRVLISQSKEETVLSRLQELGLHVTVMADTAARHRGDITGPEKESRQHNEDELAIPEQVLARFLLQVVGVVATEVQRQVTNLSTPEGSYYFLSQELSHFFLYVMHMFQSGLFRRVAVACMGLIRKETPSEYYSMDRINQAFQDIATHHPTLTLQWCNILILLNYENKAWWSEILQTQRKYVHANTESERMNGNIPTDYEKCCNLEIVRRGGLVLFCDYVCENLTDAEHMTWVIINHVSDLISLCHEPPVQDFISAIHRNPAASGLFIQAIHARCENVTEPRLVKKTLQCLEAIHLTQSGALLTLLIDKFLNTHHVAVARMCDTTACRRVEMLLAESVEDSSSQLPLEDLEKLLEFMKSAALDKRHARLVALLNKLHGAMSPLSHPILSPVLSHPLATSPLGAEAITVDKDWYVSIVKDQCYTGPSSPRESAQLLQQLDYSSMLAIFMTKEFNLGILEDCIALGVEKTLKSVRRAKGESVSSADSYTPDTPPERRLDPLLRAAQLTLLRHINSIVNMLPVPHQMMNFSQIVPPSEEQYRDKMEDMFTDPSWFTSVFHLSAALLRHLVCLPVLPVSNNIPKDTGKDVCRFMLLTLEMVFWLLQQEQLPSSSQMQTAVECCSVVLQHPDLIAVMIQREQTTWVCSAIRTIHQLLTSMVVLPGERLVTLPHQDGQDDMPETGFDDMHCAIRACDHISELVHCLHTHLSPQSLSSAIPQCLAAPLRNAIIGLARLPLVNSYARTPPLAWKLGWMPSPTGETKTTLPPVPLDLLQDKEVLAEFISRVNTLGWTSRPQFEETWMSLLGVLNPMNEQPDPTPEGDIERAQCAVLAIQGITSLLIQSMLSPQSGNPCNSVFEQRPRDKPLAFLHTRCGKKLLTVRLMVEAELLAITRQRQDLESHLPFHHQGVGRELDTHLYWSNLDSDRCPDHYVFGQMSVESIWGLVGMLDPSQLLPSDASPTSDGTSTSDSTDDSPQRQYPPVHALASPTEVKERSSTVNGLDIHSCLQFLLELYGQFLSPSANPRVPLMLLNETIKSVVALSDIFTERQQFDWMLETLTEVYRTHPAEDELISQYLVVGLCKAAAIVGVDGQTTEKIIKFIESTLKSTHLSCKVAALYGGLYLLETGVSDVTHQLIPILTDYLLKQLGSISHTSIHSKQHVLVMWTLAFHILENYKEEVKETEFITKIMQVAISTASAHEDNMPLDVYLCVLRGLERLVLADILYTTDREALVKLSVDRLIQPSPQRSLASLNLLLTCMYAGKSYDQWNPMDKLDSNSHQQMSHDPESLIIAMERVTVLFDRIRRGFPFEARVISHILPTFLADFFPPQDIMNKVIGEFLSSQQPHPQLMARVVFQVFDNLLYKGQHALVQDWVMLSLSNFTQRTPISMAMWSLTCFFVSASTNQWLRNLLPHILGRMGQMDKVDRRMFCIAALDFRRQLQDESQQRAFHSIFQSVAQPDTPYADLLNSFLPSGSNKC